MVLVTQVLCEKISTSLCCETSPANEERTAAEIVWMYAMAEQSMNSVERILVYTSLPSEGLPSESKNQPQHSWPAQGRIEFRDVELQYREGLPMVLKGITFDVQPGEKVHAFS